MKLRNIGYLALSVVVLTVSAACTKSCKGAGQKESPSVFFESLKDGDEVTSPVVVQFGLKGMTIKPAGQDVQDKTAGHHHLLIDSVQKFIPAGQAVPADARSIHYGQGETETVIPLTPGVHTLTLQFADGAHLSYGKEMAATISITVKASENEKAHEAHDHDHDHEGDEPEAEGGDAE